MDPEIIWLLLVLVILAIAATIAGYVVHTRRKYMYIVASLSIAIAIYLGGITIHLIRGRLISGWWLYLHYIPHAILGYVSMFLWLKILRLERYNKPK